MCRGEDSNLTDSVPQLSRLKRDQSGFESLLPFAVRKRMRLPRHCVHVVHLCRGEDSNLHGLPRCVLSAVRLPISPPRHLSLYRRHEFFNACPPGRNFLRLSSCRRRTRPRHHLADSRARSSSLRCSIPTREQSSLLARADIRSAPCPPGRN